MLPVSSCKQCTAIQIRLLKPNSPLRPFCHCTPFLHHGAKVQESTLNIYLIHTVMSLSALQTSYLRLAVAIQSLLQVLLSLTQRTRCSWAGRSTVLKQCFTDCENTLNHFGNNTIFTGSICSFHFAKYACRRSCWPTVPPCLSPPCLALRLSPHENRICSSRDSGHGSESLCLLSSLKTRQPSGPIRCHSCTP